MAAPEILPLIKELQFIKVPAALSHHLGRSIQNRQKDEESQEKKSFHKGAVFVSQTVIRLNCKKVTSEQ
jgi:hypothetical protein